MDGVTLAAPALVVTQDYQKRAVRTGFEFPTLDDAFTKLEEELQELKEATTPNTSVRSSATCSGWSLASQANSTSMPKRP